MNFTLGLCLWWNICNHLSMLLHLCWCYEHLYVASVNTWTLMNTCMLLVQWTLTCCFCCWVHNLYIKAHANFLRMNVSSWTQLCSSNGNFIEVGKIVTGSWVLIIYFKQQLFCSLHVYSCINCRVGKTWCASLYCPCLNLLKDLFFFNTFLFYSPAIDQRW